jgi:magnesium transporter
LGSTTRSPEDGQAAIVKTKGAQELGKAEGSETMVTSLEAASKLLEDWPTLPAVEQAARFRELAAVEAEELLKRLSGRDQAGLLPHLARDERRRLAQALSPDDAADCLQAVPGSLREELLGYLEEPVRLEVLALLAYAEDEAGGRMNPRYVRLRPEMRIDEAIAYLRRQALARAGTLYYAYVLDAENHLAGVISVRELLGAGPDRSVAEVMRTDVVRVSEHTDQEDVARLLARHDLAAIPVVDGRGRMVGIISVDDILDVVREEATEDIQRLGGTQPLADPYLRTSLPAMIARRGGWLGALFLGELLTASAMSRYQDDIARSVALALFVPLIISSGGNSGSQATTLVIRAMAVGEVRLRHWWRVLSREAAVGLTLGLLLATLGLARILAWQGVFGAYGEHALPLATIVASSLVGVVLWGSVSGAMLPFVLRSVGLDPASASAPLVATVVDVTGIVIYFSVARLVLQGVGG